MPTSAEVCEGYGKEEDDNDEERAERKLDVHDDEDGADDDALDAATEDRVGDDGERLVDDHVCKKERDEEQMSVLADRLDLVRVQLLLPADKGQYVSE